jgi:hypothetical protein
MLVQRPIPDVYVLWHPSCAIGQALASRIYSWLRPGNGFGPDVFYRCLPAPDAPAGGLPLALPGEFRPDQQSTELTGSGLKQANMQVVILLIDEHMIADPVWRYWLALLARVANSPVRRVFLPVALDSTAFNVPSPLGELNFLRPSGLPLPDSEDPKSAAALEIVIRSMLKQLTEALCRLLLMPFEATSTSRTPIGVPEGSQAKISLFLSHAKIDGGIPARRLRDYIYSQTQLAAFYDENDIPFGSAFAKVLQSSVQASLTAAMIAVKSARYASRPWCRRELALFRKPVQEESDTGMAERWRLNPMVVVNALEAGAQTSGIPEIGNATHIGWSAEQSDQEEQIVTLVLRDVLLAAFHSALGGSIPGNADQVVINWLPDPTTLLQIPRVRDSQAPVEILYPGRGLSGLELDILDELFPHVSLLSFDRASL